MIKRGCWLLLLLAVSMQAAAQPAADSQKDESDSKPAYVIGIEDKLRVVVWGEPALTMSVHVRPDGMITLPLINDVPVLGKTTNDIRAYIAEKLANFIRDPNVTVLVEEINSYRVYFLGEVQKQGAVKFYRPVRLLQAIATAGGVTQYAKKEITLLREEYGVEKRMSIDYKRMLAGDPSQENIFLKSGDTLLFQ